MFNYGSHAQKFAKMPDEEVVASALAALKVMFPSAPAKCKSYLRTNWGEDKYAKCCYTYSPAGSHLKDFDDIAASIGQKRVHFAGEHTNKEFIGTTQAALISGIVAAERIIGSYVANYTFFLMMMAILSRLPMPSFG